MPLSFDTSTPTGAVIDHVLVGHPDVADALHAAHEAAWAVVDPQILELCRLRIAQLLGSDAELSVRTAGAGVDDELLTALPSWPTSPRFGPRERSCLALCEQSVIDVAGLLAAQTEAVTAELGAQGLADLVNALLVLEQRQRLRLAWTVLFPSGSIGGSNGA